jgi:hypothetical protein
VSGTCCSMGGDWVHILMNKISLTNHSVWKWHTIKNSVQLCVSCLKWQEFNRLKQIQYTVVHFINYACYFCGRYVFALHMGLVCMSPMVLDVLCGE